MRKVVSSFLGLAALASVACGKSSSSIEGEGKVALFVNTDYVDYSPGESGSEASNMEAELKAMPGIETTTFTGITAEAFKAAVDGKHVLVIPEQENANLYPDLDGDAVNAISSFVSSGGTLVMGGAAKRLAKGGGGGSDLALVEAMLGTTISGAEVDGEIVITAAVDGTAYGMGWDTLPELSATDVLDAATLPADAKLMYVDQSGNSAVAVLPYGQGNIVLLGWDYYDAAPTGAEDGGWVAVLESSVNL
jgi:hypothetical protein